MEFRLLRRRRDLLTAAIIRLDEEWTVSWIDGDFDSGYTFQTLDEVVYATDAVVRDRYRRRRGVVPFLQYAIYPWGRADVFSAAVSNLDTAAIALESRPHAVFHISGNWGHLTATDISHASGLVLHGATPDQLVIQGSMLLGNEPTISFRWIREIRWKDAVVS
jgi:hypothetical protein